MPKESAISLAATAELSRFRGMRHSRSLPTGDKRVLFILVVHLCFLPWALGTMHAWSQITSLTFALIGFAVALTSGSGKRQVASAEAQLLPPTAFPFAQPGPLGRLLRFPPFWLGLALLLYIAVQAFNPSWRYTTNGSFWWLVPVPNISWLPTSVETPFERFNLWRQFIIYASAWLTICTVAVGLTRRRSFAILLGGLALNGMGLVVVGFILRLTRTPNQLFWFDGVHGGATAFASFIYKNHAGAYFALIAVIMLAIAARYRERNLRENAASSPALLLVLGALAMLFAVIFTYSRGATLLLGIYFMTALLAFGLHRYFFRESSGMPRVVSFVVVAMVTLVVAYALVQVDFGRVTKSFGRLVDQEHQDASITGRTDAHAASLDMLSNTWPRGVGAGNFRYLFPEYIRRYSESYRGGKLFWEHAHNDWLQLLIELGLVGSVIVAAGALWWFRQLLRRSVWRSLPALLLVLGLLQTLAHAAIDFPFQNPAVFFTWAVLAIIAVRYNQADSARG